VDITGPADSQIVLIATDPLDAVIFDLAMLGFQPLEPDPISSAR